MAAFGLTLPLTRIAVPFFGPLGVTAVRVHGDLIAFAAVVALSVALGRSRSPLLPTTPLALTRKNES